MAKAGGDGVARDGDALHEEDAALEVPEPTGAGDTVAALMSGDTTVLATETWGPSGEPTLAMLSMPPLIFFTGGWAHSASEFS